MAALKPGHDGVSMTNAENGVSCKINCLPNRRKHLPLVLSFLDKKLYVMNNCSGNKAITNGSQIFRL